MITCIKITGNRQKDQEIIDKFNELTNKKQDEQLKNSEIRELSYSN